MACPGGCIKKNTGNVTIKSTYVPKPNQSVKMSEVLMNFTVEKKSNVSTGQNKPNN